jgi:predicted lactoylglutathione lyase
MPVSSARKIFVNLPVEDLGRAIEFFKKLGFAFDERFTDETATCMIVSEEAFVMLLTKERFKDFTDKEISDAGRETEAIVSLSAESREAVDELVHAALDAGGRPAKEPLEMGNMYGWSFHDPDGHLWEVIWMDMSTIPERVPA